MEENKKLDIFDGVDAFIKSHQNGSTQTEIDDKFWFGLIKCEIISLYQKDPDSVLRCLFYIEWDREFGKPPPIWLELRDIMYGSGDSELFKNCTEKLIQETKTIEMLSNKFHEVMREAERSLKEENKDFQFEVDNEIPDLEIVLKEDIVRESSLIEFKTFVRSIIPISLASQLITHSELFYSTEELIGAISSSNAAMTFIGLTAVLLSAEILLCIRDWWKGNITGIRVLKFIIDQTVTVSAGTAGGIALGALGGSVAGPVGTVTFGFFGWLWAAHQTRTFTAYLTSKIFGIPQSAALENAYNFLGVKMTDSNIVINKAFRNLCLRHHPDKGGDPEEFMKLQMHMGVIKAAKGDI